MSRLWSALQRFLFSPVNPSRLAVLRAVICLYLLYWMLPLDLRRLGGAGRRPVEFMEPATVMSLIPLPFPMTTEVLTVFGMAMAGLGLMAAFGVLTRPALLLFALGYLWMGAAISSWGYVTHSRILPLQVLLILAFAPGTTAWSVDRLVLWLVRSRRRAGQTWQAFLAGPPVPGWGVQLTVVLVAALLFSAGVSKVRYAGLQWADGQTLGFYLSNRTVTNLFTNLPDDVDRPRGWNDGFVQFVSRPGLPAEAQWKDGVGVDGYLYMARATPIGDAIARRPRALRALATFTLLVELAAPLVLLGAWARSAYLLAACGFFVGIYVSMGINFLAWVVVILCVVEWRPLTAPLVRWVPALPRVAWARPIPVVGTLGRETENR